MTPRPLLDETWISVDRPVLLAAAQLVEKHPRRLATIPQIAASTALDPAIVLASIPRLRHRYIDVWDASTNDGPDYVVKDITEAGMREVGMWPDATDAYDRVVESLEAAISAARPEEKGKIQGALAGVVGMGRDLVVEVIGSALTKQLV